MTVTSLRDLKELLDQDVTGVSEEISPNDLMYNTELQAHADPVLARRVHLFWGQAAVRSVKLALLAAGRENAQNILDLPCGHGRVLRTLRAAFPSARITACDLDRDGVDFCARTFAAIPVYSREQPEDIEIDGGFDLIWCGSLLTHLNSDGWFRFLSVFDNLLAPGGVLVFSVHGRFYEEVLRGGNSLGLTEPLKEGLLADYSRDGFGYRDYPSQSKYGISLSAPAWVCSTLNRIPTLRLVSFHERGWGNWHDVIACVRTI